MSSQSTTEGNQKKDENMAMKDEATGDEKTIQKAKAEDDDCKKEQKIGQKAMTYAGIETPVLEDDDDKFLAKTSGKAGKDDAAKTSGKASCKAGKDDAAKNLGKADSEAGEDAHDQEQEDAFVSPEDLHKKIWKLALKP